MLTLEDVRRIAHLARLELNAADEAAMLTQLNGFFGIVERMSAVDTRGVEPLYTPLAALHEVASRLREDVVTEMVDGTDEPAAHAAAERARHQASAPAVQDGLYLVPKVIE
jgi:aspartyl-tRNA(Asn)/glutamyl-tRNA(Gln) amidotransferase subunit C